MLYSKRPEYRMGTIHSYGLDKNQQEASLDRGFSDGVIKDVDAAGTSNLFQ